MTELIKVNKPQSKEIDMLVLESKDLKNEIKDLKNENKDLKNEIKDLMNESKDLINQVKDLNNRTIGLEKLTQIQAESLRVQASEIKNVKADLHKLETICQRLKALEVAVAELLAFNAHNKAVNQQLTDKVNRLERESDKIKAEKLRNQLVQLIYGIMDTTIREIASTISHH